MSQSKTYTHIQLSKSGNKEKNRITSASSWHEGRAAYAYRYVPAGSFID